MPKNKKERIVFTLLMCTMMVLGMSIYNTFLQKGLDGLVFSELLLGFIPAFLVALLLDVVIVGPIAKKAAFKILGIHRGKMPHTALVISSCMVCGMVACMSLFGLIMQGSNLENLGLAYLQIIGKNALCAFPLQLLLVGPLARLFLKKVQLA